MEIFFATLKNSKIMKIIFASSKISRNMNAFFWKINKLKKAVRNILNHSKKMNVIFASLKTLKNMNLIFCKLKKG